MALSQLAKHIDIRYVIKILIVQLSLICLMKKKPTSSLGNFSKMSALSKNSTWRCLEVVSHGCPLVLLLIGSSSVLKYGRSFTEHLCRSFLLTYPLGLWRSKCHCLSWQKHCSKLKVNPFSHLHQRFQKFSLAVWPFG